MQLIHLDNSSASTATVTFEVWSSDGVTQYMTSTSAPYNSNLKGYHATLPVCPGSYFVVWNITGITNFPSDLTTWIGVDRCDCCDGHFEVVRFKEDNLPKIEDIVTKILGLSHSNMLIDQAVYDGWGNLQSARVRTYTNAASVGTNTNIIETYRITADTMDACKFRTWKQIVE